MKIVIIGNGKTGYYLSNMLIKDGHDITIIDKSEEAVTRAENELDAKCVLGSGTDYALLEDSDIGKADVLIATTGSDEMNMLSCMFAKNLGTKFAIARVRDAIYNKEYAMLRREFGIDMIINPEQTTASEIARILRFPQATDIETFCNNRIEIIGFRVEKSDFIVGSSLMSIVKKLDNMQILFCAVERGNQTYIPNGAFVIEAGDTVHVIADNISMSAFFKKLRKQKSRIKNVMIIGGGRLTFYLASILKKIKVETKIIESNPEKCEILSEALGIPVIHGDGTDQDLLFSENIENVDAFVALTNRDEDNFMTALFAKQCGVDKIIIKNNRQNYSNVVKSLGIEGLISPKVITGNHILRFVRAHTESEGSEMHAVYKIADDNVEVMEFGITAKMKKCDIPLKDINFKTGILIAAIMRNGKAFVPGGDDIMQVGDSLIIVALGKTISAFDEIFE